MKNSIRFSIKKQLPKLDWESTPIISCVCDVIQATHRVYKVDYEGRLGYFREVEEDLVGIKRMLAARQFSLMLGLNNTPNHFFARMNWEGNIYRGIFQEQADGINIIPIEHSLRREMITPAFQRSLSNLNIMDVLTREQDHSPNNYRVKVDSEGNAIGVDAFDNNGAGTFSHKTSIEFTTFKGCSPIVNKSGTMNRPFLDEELISCLNQLSLYDLFFGLSEYLSISAIFALWYRMKKLMRAVAKAPSGAILKPTEWSDLTIQEELSGKYGKTYLVSFIEDCCVPNNGQ